MREMLKTLGGGAVALLAILAVVLISVLLIQGGVWLGALLYPWLLALNGVALAVTVFLLLPNAIFSSTPRFAGSGMMIVSYVFSATPWVWGLLLTYALWGGLGLFIGLFMAGVGVVPCNARHANQCNVVSARPTVSLADLDDRRSSLGLQPTRKGSTEWLGRWTMTKPQTSASVSRRG